MTILVNTKHSSCYTRPVNTGTGCHAKSSPLAQLCNTYFVQVPVTAYALQTHIACQCRLQHAHRGNFDDVLSSLAQRCQGAMRQSSAAKGRTKWEMTFTSLPSAGIMNCTLYGRLDESCLPLNVLMTCEAHSAPLPDVVNLYQHDERVLHLSMVCFTPQSGNAGHISCFHLMA